MITPIKIQTLIVNVWVYHLPVKLYHTLSLLATAQIVSLSQ